MALKYKAGDQVRIKSLDWYNKNIKNNGIIICGSESFTHPMSHFCDKVVTIVTIQDDCYRILEDDGDWYWTDEMIECKVEEETVHNKWTGLKVELELSKTVIGVSNVESLRGERFMSGFVKAIIPPEGYIFKDENGNVINATKIVLEKKEYPKTLEECCEVLDTGGYQIDYFVKPGEVYEYEKALITKISAFYNLIICRDAYWKLYGEEMGLGKPWEPDWEYDDTKYVLFFNKNEICHEMMKHTSYVLAFPTPEMRDAFYENFKELIEQCKELL